MLRAADDSDESSLTSRPGRAATASVLNAAGLLLPLLVAILLLPRLASALGPTSFGLFVLTWTLLDYLGFADLGFSRATARFVAVDLARERSRAVRQTIALTMVAQASIGILIAGMMLLLAAPIAERLLQSPAELQGATVLLVRTAALHLPVLLLTAGLRSALEGAQRFALSAALRAPLGAAAIAVAVLAAGAGASLWLVMLAVLGIRLLGLAAHLVAVRHAVPGFRWEWPRRWARLRRMLGFGGWVAVSSLVSPILIYAERFLLAIVAGPATAGRYALPHEALHRLLVVPAAIASAILPILSHLEATGRYAEARALTADAARHTLLLLAPAVALVLAFAPELLTAWLGNGSQELVWVVRWLAIGVLWNSVVHAPYAALLAANRPDIPARAHLVELAAYFPVAMFLVATFGMEGAAAAWTLRVVLDGIVLAIATRRLPGARRRHESSVAAASALLVTGLAVACLIAARLPGAAAAITALGTIALYVAGCWYVALLPAERGYVRRSVALTIPIIADRR